MGKVNDTWNNDLQPSEPAENTPQSGVSTNIFFQHSRAEISPLVTRQQRNIVSTKKLSLDYECNKVRKSFAGEFKCQAFSANEPFF